jgi:hypothetical protein
MLLSTLDLLTSSSYSLRRDVRCERQHTRNTPAREARVRAIFHWVLVWSWAFANHSITIYTKQLAGVTVTGLFKIGHHDITRPRFIALVFTAPHTISIVTMLKR